MKLYEYETRLIASKYGIPMAKGKLALSPEQAAQVAEDIGTPVVVKAQVPAKGRGKDGGVLTARTPSEAELLAKIILNKKIKGFTPRSILIEKKISFKKELYFGLMVDRSSRSYVIIGSTEGGLEIEDVPNTAPEKIEKVYVDPIEGFHPFQARELVRRLGFTGSQLIELSDIFFKLYRLAMDYDAVLMESNPILIKYDGKFVTTDPRIVIDDNALFRHQKLIKKLMEKRRLACVKEEMESEIPASILEARKVGLDYVKLGGDIGVIGNGAGLVMATLDMIKWYGGKPANFLDVGGGASSEKMAAALNVVLSDPAVKGLFINILGGITNCDEIAQGIAKSRKWFKSTKPTVIRLMGTNEEEGKRILKDAAIPIFDSMEEAAEHIVNIVKRPRAR